MKLKSVLQRHRAYKTINEVIAPDFKLYSILLTWLILLQVLSFFCLNEFNVFGFDIDLSSVLFTIQIYVYLTIAELYGFEYARKSVWISSLGCLLIALCSYEFAHLPDAAVMPDSYLLFYTNRFDNVWRNVLISTLLLYIPVVISVGINSFLKNTKLKQYVWVRLMIATTALYLMISVIHGIELLVKHYKTVVAISSLLQFLLINCGISLLELVFIVYLIKFLKSVEGLEIYDVNQNYKLFAFNINSKKMRIEKL